MRGSLTFLLSVALLFHAIHVDAFSASMSLIGSQNDSSTTPNSNLLDRRTAVTTAVVSAVSVLAGSPTKAVASYIDPNTDPQKITKKVYLDVKITGKRPAEGRLVIGLFGGLMPRAVDNFVSLCNDNKYAGTTFYRVISGVSIQGGNVGDITGKTGKSSLEGGKPFEPDNFNLKHTKSGLVSAVRSLDGAIDSRFFINVAEDAGWADDRYAAFGEVLEGMDLVRQIEKVDVQPPRNAPKEEVSIVACGVL